MSLSLILRDEIGRASIILFTKNGLLAMKLSKNIKDILPMKIKIENKAKNQKAFG